MATATNLKVGDHIHAESVGYVTVVEKPRIDCDEASMPVWVEVDVEPRKPDDIWDTNLLATATGASSAAWISGVRKPRYRLGYVADASVRLV